MDVFATKEQDKHDLIIEGPKRELPFEESGYISASSELAVPDTAVIQLSSIRRRTQDRTSHICADCGKEFKRHCDLVKHEKSHLRVWKCPEQDCKYHELGWPTEKERDRHVQDKHSAAPPQYKCLYPPCPYVSKRDSNCKQHMEKAHGWEYVRSKSNGRKKATLSGETSVPQEPHFNHGVPTTPLTPYPGEYVLPFEDVALDVEMDFSEFTEWSFTDYPAVLAFDDLPGPGILDYPPLDLSQTIGGVVSSPGNEGETTGLGLSQNNLTNVQTNAKALELEQHNKEPTLRSAEESRSLSTNGSNEWDPKDPLSAKSSPHSVEESANEPRDSAESGLQDGPTARAKPSIENTLQSISRSQSQANAIGRETPSQQAPQPKDASEENPIPPVKASETQKLKRKEPPQPREKRRLMSCIFRKYKPSTYNYGIEKFKTCHTTSHQYISTLIRHLERYHEANICHHCLKTFALQEEAKKHKEAQDCPSVSGSQEVKWQILYEKLCGDGVRHDPGFDSAGDKGSSICHQDESCKKARVDGCLQVSDEAKVPASPACSQIIPRPQLATPPQTPAATPQIQVSCVSMDERKELEQLREENNKLLRENNMLLRRLLQLESEPKGLG